jgi:hypothetical protein
MPASTVEENTIQTGTRRETVGAAARFSLCRKAAITFTHERIPNMIHSHFTAIGPIIPPYDCYIPEEIRPYYPNTMVEFRLADSASVPDALWEDGGVSGGMNAHGQVLPPVIFPKGPIDTTVGSKDKAHQNALRSG